MLSKKKLDPTLSPDLWSHTRAIAQVPFDPSCIETKIFHIGSTSLAIDVIQDMDKAHQFLLSRRKFELKNWTDTDIFPHFGVIWPSALALAAELEQFLQDPTTSPHATRGHNSSDSRSLKCLELGCGLAIPSLLLKKNWSHHDTVVTDRHPWVPHFLDRNMRKNKVQLEYFPLDWRASGSFANRFPWIKPHSYDLIYGSDLLYYPWQPRSLAETIALLVKPEQGRALVADPGRRFMDEFRAQTKSFGLSILHESVRSIPWGQTPVNVKIVQIGSATPE